MPATLIVWLLEPPRFVLVDSATLAVVGSYQDATLLPPVKPEQTIALVPGELVYATQLTLAAKQRSKQLKALGFLLEEELATELDGLHWSAVPNAALSVDVLVTERRFMEAWLQRLTDWGLRADVVIPDYLALPQINTLYAAGSRWLLRSGPNSGASAEPELIAALYQELNQAEPLEPPVQLGASDLAQLAAKKPTQNLLAQTFASESSFASPLRAYRWVALAACVAGLIALLGLGLNVYRLGRADVQLDAEMERVFREARPDVKRIIDPRAQLAQEFTAATNGGQARDALGLISALGRAKQSSPGLKIKTLSFRDGGLQVDIHARALADLDRLMASLGADTRVRAEVKSAASGADGVSARVNVIAGAVQ